MSIQEMRPKQNGAGYLLAANDGDLRTEGVAVLDATGNLRYLNSTWRKQIGSMETELCNNEEGYLTLLRVLFDPESNAIHEIANGLRMVLESLSDYEEVEYLDSYREDWNWFLLQISAYFVDNTRCVLLLQKRAAELLQERVLSCG